MTLQPQPLARQAPRTLPTFVALDFETANHDPASACALAVVRVVAGRVEETWHSLLRPPTRLFTFTDVHGLRWTDVATAPTFGDVIPELRRLIGSANGVFAHNASFDRRVLESCFRRAGSAVPSLRWFCTVRAARDAFGIFPTTLAHVSTALNIPLNHHEALSDARACAAIATRALRTSGVDRAAHWRLR